MPDIERNRNALRSQRLIREAFITLANERGDGRITVADICRAADINRATFYAHYDSLEALQDFYIQDTLDGFGRWYASEQERAGFLEDPLPGLTRLGEYIEYMWPLLTALERRHLKAAESFGMGVRRSLLSVLGDLEGERLMRFDFIAAALTNVYYTWCVGSYGEMTIAELNESLAGYIRQIAT